MPIRRSKKIANQQNGFFVNEAVNPFFLTDPTVQWTLNNVTEQLVSSNQLSLTAAGDGFIVQAFDLKKGRTYQFKIVAKKGTAETGIINLLFPNGQKQTLDFTALTDYSSFNLILLGTQESVSISVGFTGTINQTLFFESIELFDITSDLSALLTNAKLEIIQGTQSASAHAAISVDDILCAISSPLDFVAADLGDVIKSASQDWSGAIIKTGVAEWFRISEAGDDTTQYSEDTIRLDGEVGKELTSSLRVFSTTLILGSPDLSIRDFTYRVNYNGN